MTEEQVNEAITGLNDPGTAVIIANTLVKSENAEQINAFLVAVIKKAAEGHHQSREIASAALILLNGLNHA